MQRACDFCQKPYVARRSDSRFCSSTCRSKNATGAVVPLRAAPTPVSSRPKLSESVRSDLREAGAEATALGAAALVLADVIDNGGESGTSLAALNRELRATLAEATRGQVKSGLASLRDELAERRRHA